ncbi:hypothetical protein [Ramlibacter humi]|uniref:hypothetical protein n=1 Tax=Ramlibacter humi TaxID=2530451 RepID=UPI00142FF64F|nr:hypothetical protein [Ramlibacter humi]
MPPLAALCAATLAAALLLLATLGLEEWFAPLALACIVSLLPVVPALLRSFWIHRHRQ